MDLLTEEWMMSILHDVAKVIGKPIYHKMNELLAKVRSEQSAAIPKFELTERHISHLQVVTDRRSFLECMPSKGVFAEVGVASGDFSAMILEMCRPTELHLVDCWTSTLYSTGRTRVQARFANEIASGRVKIDLGLSLDVLETYPNHTFDWIYIDTDHSYATTKRELAMAACKVKTDGIIAGHDYVTGNWNGGVRYGVVEAVHEFCVRQDWELILLSHEIDRHLSFAIRKIGA